MTKAKQPSSAQKTNTRRALILGSALFVIVLLSAADGFLAYAYQYRDKVYRGIVAGDQNIGGLTKEQLEAKILSYKTNIEKNGLQIRSASKTYRLLTSDDSTDSTLARDYIRFSMDNTADQALAIGRTGGMFADFKTQFLLLFTPKAVSLDVEYSEEFVDDALKDFFGDEQTPAVNSSIQISDDGTLSVSRERAGKIFPWKSIHQTIRNRLFSLSNEPVDIALVIDEPTVSQSDAQAQENSVHALLDRLPITLKNGEKSWSITRDIIKKGLALQRSGEGLIEFSLTPKSLDDLYNSVANSVEVAPLDAKFKIENGRVAEFQASRVGVSIDRDQTTVNIIAALNDEKKSEAALATKEQAPQYETTDANQIGITELVAVGKTNFAGSPVNRRHNIKTGAEKLNGLLIKPGETFSTITAVGPVDGKNGYKQELVIKGNRTVPEYGGGLCQIGTTLFRLVLNAGLPVVERRNHSYRVSYYEPPVGMDATIYEPKPDFRFTNDFTTPLLLQTRVVGNDLIFEFYGTKDDRVSKTTTPRIYNLVKPGPKKVIETDTLAPGKTKCIEKAHTGSDAEFTYTVTYSDGQTKKTTFQSHYKPWQEVCLVGKAAAPKTETQTQ